MEAENKVAENKEHVRAHFNVMYARSPNLRKNMQSLY